MLNSVNDKLALFEREARQSVTHEKIAAPKETAKQIQPGVVAREFVADKAFDVLSEITLVKKEMKILAENTVKTLQEEISKATKGDSQDIDAEIHKEAMIQKLMKFALLEKFSNETEEIATHRKTIKETGFI